MTNVLRLPRLHGSFAIARNADWLDSIYFASPGQTPDAINKIGTVTQGASRVNLLDGLNGIYSGMSVTAVEIPVNARVGNITFANPTYGISDGFDLVTSDGALIPATASNAAARLVMLPSSFDLTGIEFIGEVRRAVGQSQVFLSLSTEAGTLVNGGASGYLSFNVPQAQLRLVDPGNYVLDIIAIADGHRVNLFPVEPATLMINAGVTSEPVRVIV